MLRVFSEILLINAYWFSLPLIGYCLLIVVHEQKQTPAALKQAIASVLERHVFIKAFLSFAFISAIFAIVALVCYLFSLPVAVLAAFYVCLLGFTLFILGRSVLRNALKVESTDWLRLRSEFLLAKLAFVLLVVFLVADFLIALYAKSHAVNSADTYVHLSRIVAILSQGFTVESGFFRDVAEGGYHYNLIYALYAIPAQLFNILPFNVWSASFGFFRLLQWMAIFTLADYAWRNWLRDNTRVFFAATLTTILAIALFSPAFFIATYPNQIANAWLILLVIGLSVFEASKLPYIFVMAAVLLTFTHPTYALMAIVFLCMFMAVRVIFIGKRVLKDSRYLAVMGSTLAILLLGPLRTFLFPNRMTEVGFNVGDFEVIRLGFMTMMKPHFGFFAHPFNTMLFLIGTTGLYALLYYLRKDKKQFSIVLTLILFYPIVAFFPPAFTVLHSILPVWLIDRFMAMNGLTYVSVAMGLYYFFVFVSRQAKTLAVLPVSVKMPSQRTAYLMAFIVILCLSLFYLRQPGRFLTQYRAANDHYYDFMTRTYGSFHHVLKGEKMVVANQGDSYFLAAIFPIDVIAVEEGHTTPAADAKHRIQCQKRLLHSMAYADLKSIDAKYVAISKYEEDFDSMKLLADSRPFLKLVAGNTDFLIYSFDSKVTAPSPGEKPYKPCLIYQDIEKS